MCFFLQKAQSSTFRNKLPKKKSKKTDGEKVKETGRDSRAKDKESESKLDVTEELMNLAKLNDIDEDTINQIEDKEAYLEQMKAAMERPPSSVNVEILINSAFTIKQK